MIKVSKEVIKNRKSKDWKYIGQTKKTKRIATVLKTPPDTYNFQIIWLSNLLTMSVLDDG
jgi:hypothetical protein